MPTREDHAPVLRDDSGDSAPAQARGSVFDPRIDKALTWALMTLATVAFSIGAWFFASIQTGLTDLRKEVVDLRLQCKGMEADRKDIDSLQRQIDRLREELAEVRKR